MYYNSKIKELKIATAIFLLFTALVAVLSVVVIMYPSITVNDNTTLTFLFITECITAYVTYLLILDIKKYIKKNNVLIKEDYENRSNTSIKFSNDGINGYFITNLLSKHQNEYCNMSISKREYSYKNNTEYLIDMFMDGHILLEISIGNNPEETRIKKCTIKISSYSDKLKIKKESIPLIIESLSEAIRLQSYIEAKYQEYSSYIRIDESLMR